MGGSDTKPEVRLKKATTSISTIFIRNDDVSAFGNYGNDSAKKRSIDIAKLVKPIGWAANRSVMTTIRFFFFFAASINAK